MSLLDRVKEYYNNTPIEQIQKDWDSCSEWDDINSPSADDFIEYSKKFLLNHREAKDYIVSEIMFIRRSFYGFGISIKYEYRDTLNTHIIEVNPKSFFEKNESYAKMQLSIQEEFEKRFFNQEILFMTKNNLIEVKNPIFEFKSIPNEKTTSN